MKMNTLCPHGIPMEKFCDLCGFESLRQFMKEWYANRSERMFSNDRR